jgi:hypothetical protein
VTSRQTGATPAFNLPTLLYLCACCRADAYTCGCYVWHTEACSHSCAWLLAFLAAFICLPSCFLLIAFWWQCMQGHFVTPSCLLCASTHFPISRMDCLYDGRWGCAAFSARVDVGVQMPFCNLYPCRLRFFCSSRGRRAMKQHAAGVFCPAAVAPFMPQPFYIPCRCWRCAWRLTAACRMRLHATAYHHDILPVDAFWATLPVEPRGAGAAVTDNRRTCS